jgi:hypothetical protein
VLNEIRYARAGNKAISRWFGRLLLANSVEKLTVGMIF